MIVPVSIKGKPGSLVITSHPNDEINEIWEGIVTQLQVGSAIAAVLFLMTMKVVSRALAPIQSLSDAMTNIEAGRYDTRVEPEGPPELAAICGKLNHLAATLGDAVEGKRRLAERAVSVQDAERQKEIARELHDEFGPHLFALRAHASSLMRAADTGEVSTETLRKHGSAILDQINALQQFNRRVLERLRPVGLAELGLYEAIGALLRLWRETHPGVIVQTAISRSLGVTGETAELTIYRIIQEALTNVFRHAGATHVEITVEPASSRQTGATPAGTEAIAVSIRDNGAGLPSDHKQGFGMIGMRERVLALGGTMAVGVDQSGCDRGGSSSLRIAATSGASAGSPRRSFHVISLRATCFRPFSSLVPKKSVMNRNRERSHHVFSTQFCFFVGGRGDIRRHVARLGEIQGQQPGPDARHR